ncbi:DUF86 domain-containing protein [Fibrobacterota bacterium]
MSNRPVKLLLEDISEAVEKAERYIEGLNFDAFEKNEKTIDAVVRNLEIIGEAANNLTEAFKRNHADIEWSKVIGLRHRIIHGYFGVDLDIIWQILKNDLPVFKHKLSLLQNSIEP